MAWALGSRYLVGERLGSGGMGAVYRAARRDGGPDRAVKLLRPELADNPVILARFVQERVLMLALRSPHLVVVEDLIVDGDVVAIVMELVSGGTLRQHMTVNGPLSEGEAFEAIRQVLLGLGVVHGHGVVHRDVKPENVLIGTNPETGGLTIKVSDFGIARLLDGPHLTGTFEYIGTVHYSAPEIAQGLPPTPATDVYAVGVMLYELLSGATPFAGGAPIAVMKRQLEQPPPRPPMIGDSAWALILRWLDAEPGARPADAWEALREINELQTASDGASAAAPLPGAELKLGPTAAPSSFVIPGQAAPIASSPGAGAFILWVASAVAAGDAAASGRWRRSPGPSTTWQRQPCLPPLPTTWKSFTSVPADLATYRAGTTARAVDGFKPSLDRPGIRPVRSGAVELGRPMPRGREKAPHGREEAEAYGDPPENAAPQAGPRRRKGLTSRRSECSSPASSAAPQSC